MKTVRLPRSEVPVDPGPPHSRSPRAKAVFVLKVLCEFERPVEVLDLVRTIRKRHARTEFGANAACSALDLLEVEGAAERVKIDGRYAFRALAEELPEKEVTPAVPKEKRERNDRGYLGGERYLPSARGRP